MTKKIVWGIVLFGLIGVLVAGAVVRTVAKAGGETEATGGRHGSGGNQEIAGTWGADAAEAPRQGQAGGQARGGGSGDGTGIGQAQVDEWLTLEGIVVSADATALVVQTTAGEQVVVENRPWSFAQEQGFTAQPGDQVMLAAFDDEGAIEVGQILDITAGQSVRLRDDSGRPMWAGRGRRSG
jgi:hypothetical protein